MKKLLFIFLSLSVFACSTNQSNTDETSATNNKGNKNIAQKDGTSNLENVSNPENTDVSKTADSGSENAANSLKNASPQAYPYNSNAADLAKADQDLNDFLEMYEPKKLITKIDNHYNQAVMGTNGVVCVFPAGCFDLKNPNDSVQIELIEYKKPTDFLFAGLGTVSGDKILETGGTAYVNATVNGEKVGLKTDYLIAFKEAEKPKKNMQLFSGEPDANGQIDWGLGSETLMTIQEVVRHVDTIYSSREITGDLPYLFEIYENGNAENSLKGFRAKNGLASGIEEVFFKLFSDTIGGVAKFDLKTIEIISDASGKFKASYTFRDGKLKTERNKTLYNFLNRRFGKGNEKNMLPNTKMVFKLAEKAPHPVRRIINITESVRLEVVSSNTYRTRQTGWINCDRFPAKSNRETVQFAIKIENLKSTKVQLYFPSMYSFLPLEEMGNKSFSSPNIKIGELVKVIVFGINSKGEEVMAYKEIRVSEEMKNSKKTMIIDSFEAFSDIKLKKDLDIIKS
ncbi:MAG: hypothetical protein EAZ97_06605 [Bacteroidetes bacterium]|nr:MAG: hypothetical protein EAZ97_06605 [Bacteroidota bacterium]